MSILAIFCLLFALLAVALLVLHLLQRRQRGALVEVTRQLHRIAVGGSLRGRVELDTDHRELAALVTVANHLLTRAASATPESQPASPAPVSVLGDRLHEAVIIHGSRGIVYANPQFAGLIGAQPGELLGRRLEDLVPPEFAELVSKTSAIASPMKQLPRATRLICSACRASMRALNSVPGRSSMKAIAHC